MVASASTLFFFKIFKTSKASYHLVFFLFTTTAAGCACSSSPSVICESCLVLELLILSTSVIMSFDFSSILKSPDYLIESNEICAAGSRLMSLKLTY